MYNLFVTRADGTTFKTLRSPYSNRREALSTVRTVIWGTVDGPPSEQVAETIADFARNVAAAPLGESVIHTPSGITFRTERA